MAERSINSGIPIQTHGHFKLYFLDLKSRLHGAGKYTLQT
jgi:hypothetical protein